MAHVKRKNKTDDTNVPKSDNIDVSLEDLDLTITDSTRPSSSDHDDEVETTEDTKAPQTTDATSESDKDSSDNSKEIPADVQLGTAFKATALTAQPKKSKRRKKILLGLLISMLLIAGLLIFPYTRYLILGYIIKKDVHVVVTDKTTKKPVSSVELNLDGHKAKTNAKGEVTFRHIPVGDAQVTAKKKYYKDGSSAITVPIRDPKHPFSVHLTATGRQVPVTVINKISGQPLEKATVTSLDASSTTDQNGETTLVLPADKTSAPATISREGFDSVTTNIVITEQQDAKNTIALVPAGKIYFLSKRTGTIDVMKSNIDGSESEVVLAGTGREEDGGTVLLASRDWKYLALKARRDSDKAKLYLIDTTQQDTLKTIDEGDIELTLNGWSGHYFIYTVQRNAIPTWQAKNQALKSYDAANSKLAILDETSAQSQSADNYVSEYINSPYGFDNDTYIVDGQIVYTKELLHSYMASPEAIANSRMRILAIRPDGSNKRTLKEFPADNYTSIEAKAYRPQEIYYEVRTGTYDNVAYYEFEDDKITSLTDAKVAAENFAKPYPTYIVSPSGEKSFWSEARDGKDVLLLGDKQGGNSTILATLENMVPYGWYSDDYVFVSKNSSELYILARQNGGKDPLKVTDYHKPQVDFSGYGYGYGGF